MRPLSTLLALALALLLSAAACAPYDPGPFRALASVELGAECIETIDWGNRWWGRRLGMEGGAFPLSVTSDELPSTPSNETHPRVVAFVPMAVTDHVRGRTLRLEGQGARRGRLGAATVHLGLCSPEVVLHEIGHALLLEDLDDAPGALMHRAVNDGAAITADELRTAARAIYHTLDDEQIARALALGEGWGEPVRRGAGKLSAKLRGGAGGALWAHASPIDLLGL